jgi:hypothetical protein
VKAGVERGNEEKRHNQSHARVSRLRQHSRKLATRK